MNALLPQRKVVAGGVAGAVCVLLIKLLRQVGIEFTADDALSLWVVVNFALQYLIPNAKVQDETLTDIDPPAA